MNKRSRFIIIVLFLMTFAASTLYAGYRIDPWGSRTWTGPGRPPHWSPERAKPPNKPVKPVHPIVPGKPVHPGYGVQLPGRSDMRGGYWKDRKKRWHYHKQRRVGYVYYREPRVETRIIVREKRVPVYIPVRYKPTKLQCGGRTVTRKDPKTGVLTIEYVTGARDCP